MNLIFQLSTRIEVYLLIYTVRCPLCETRTEGSIISKWNLSIFCIVVHCSVQEVYIKVENGLHS
jgi:hypothetical protein